MIVKVLTLNSFDALTGSTELDISKQNDVDDLLAIIKKMVDRNGTVEITQQD